MVWDTPTYTGYKLNCYKKKKKVENMIELYDKDSVNNVWDKEICKQKLEEISTAALEAVEYMSNLIVELEEGQEAERVTELTAIKKAVTDAVKKNDKEVRAEMQRILDEASVSATPRDSTAPATAHDLQEALAGLQLGAGGGPPPHNHIPGPGLISKLTKAWTYPGRCN